MLVFDLDGTLIDSKQDLVVSVNAMRSHFGHSDLDADKVSEYVGDGAAMLVRRALGETATDRDVEAALGSAALSVVPAAGNGGPAAELIASMARFSDGAEHDRRRELLVSMLPPVAGTTCTVDSFPTTCALVTMSPLLS